MSVCTCKCLECVTASVYRRKRSTGSQRSAGPVKSCPGDILNPQPSTKPAAASGSFAAMKSSPYRAQFAAYVLAMMADNIEHVISYWVVFQKFHSPALAGFAVLSHWLPFLLFSVAGRLAGRPLRSAPHHPVRDAAASSWPRRDGDFSSSPTRFQMWHAMLLLVIHGCAGVLWQTPNQLLLYDIVGPANLPSAVRLNATARYLGILVGPAVGGVIMLALGPIARHHFQHAVLSADAALAVLGARPAPKDAAPRRIPVRGLADIMQTIRDIGTQRVADLDDAARRG